MGSKACALWRCHIAVHRLFDAPPRNEAIFTDWLTESSLGDLPARRFPHVHTETGAEACCKGVMFARSASEDDPVRCRYRTGSSRQSELVRSRPISLRSREIKVSILDQLFLSMWAIMMFETSTSSLVTGVVYVRRRRYALLSGANRCPWTDLSLVGPGVE